MKKTKKATFELWEVLVIALISSLIMSISTGYVIYQKGSDADCSKITDSTYLNEFISSYNSIVNNYYAEINEQDLINAAINGMMSYLDDPYTTYLDQNNTEYLIESLKGTYEGVGIQVDMTDEGLIIIEKVFSESPAAKAGVLVGDVIKQVGDINVQGKTATEVVEIIKASKEKKITIIIERAAETLTFNLERATLLVPAVEAAVFQQNNQKVGYLQLSKFSETAPEQFKTGLLDLEKQNINSLIIDLRGNTGGYLKGASDIAELFLKQGSLIYSLKNKLTTQKEKATTADYRNYKVYILINGGSASASEVLAAALKYSYGETKLIGEISYGKGKVQQTSDLGAGAMLKYTTAEWLTPEGNCIEGIGLKPDITVALEEGRYPYPYNLNAAEDSQLQTAIYEITK